jgi:hypothetical protein
MSKIESPKTNIKDPWDDPKYVGKNLRCNVCMYATNRALNFEEHLKSKKHLKNIEIDRQLEEIEKYQDKPQDAPITLKDKKGRLKDEHDVKQSLYKKHRCDVCNKTFDSTTILKRHQKSDEHFRNELANERNTVEGMIKNVDIQENIVEKNKIALEKAKKDIKVLNSKFKTSKNISDKEVKEYDKLEQLEKTLEATLQSNKDKLKGFKKHLANLKKNPNKKLSDDELSELFSSKFR